MDGVYSALFVSSEIACEGDRLAKVISQVALTCKKINLPVPNNSPTFGEWKPNFGKKKTSETESTICQRVILGRAS